MEADTVHDRERRSAPTTEVVDGLNDLLQLDHDAVGAYQIAIEKLEDRDHADQIAGFQRDHERHIERLNEAIAALGGTPVNEPHATGPFKEAMQRLGALAGDKGILMAWRVNELQVRTKYDNYASKAISWPDDLKRLVDENALDEERHYRWVAEVLERMGVAPGEGLETDIASRVREGWNTMDVTGRAREAVDQVRDSAAEVVDQVRAGAAGVVDQVRDTAAGAVDQARTRAADLAGQVRDTAGNMAETARLRTADGIESAAHSLDRVAEEQMTAEAGARARVGEAAHRVAGGMESTADYLRRADAQKLRSDLEHPVRTSPVQSLVILFATGFIIGRLLR